MWVVCVWECCVYVSVLRVFVWIVLGSTFNYTQYMQPVASKFMLVEYFIERAL